MTLRTESPLAGTVTGQLGLIWHVYYEIEGVQS